MNNHIYSYKQFVVCLGGDAWVVKGNEFYCSNLAVCTVSLGDTSVYVCCDDRVTRRISAADSSIDAGKSDLTFAEAVPRVINW